MRKGYNSSRMAALPENRGIFMADDLPQKMFPASIAIFSKGRDRSVILRMCAGGLLTYNQTSQRSGAAAPPVLKAAPSYAAILGTSAA